MFFFLREKNNLFNGRNSTKLFIFEGEKTMSKKNRKKENKQVKAVTNYYEEVNETTDTKVFEEVTTETIPEAKPTFADKVKTGWFNNRSWIVGGLVHLVSAAATAAAGIAVTNLIYKGEMAAHGIPDDFKDNYEYVAPGTESEESDAETEDSESETAQYDPNAYRKC